MLTKEMEDVLNSTTWRKIPSIIPYMKPFLENAIVGKRRTGNKELLWYGLWETGNPILESETSFKSIKQALGKDFHTEVRDFNLVFGRSGTCSAFMIRKILEKATFLALIKNGVDESKLKDNGKYHGLETLLQLAGKVKVRGIPILNPKTLSKIQGVKFLGDVSAHNYLVNVEMDDITPQMPFIVIGLKEIAKCL